MAEEELEPTFTFAAEPAETDIPAVKKKRRRRRSKTNKKPVAGEIVSNTNPEETN